MREVRRVHARRRDSLAEPTVTHTQFHRTVVHEKHLRKVALLRRCRRFNVMWFGGKTEMIILLGMLPGGIGPKNLMTQKQQWPRAHAETTAAAIVESWPHTPPVSK